MGSKGNRKPKKHKRKTSAKKQATKQNTQAMVNESDCDQQEQQRTITPKNAEEGTVDTTTSQEAIVQTNQHTGDQKQKQRKCTAQKVLIILIFVILFLPPPFWILLLPVSVLLCVTWCYKTRKETPSNLDRPQSEDSSVPPSEDETPSSSSQSPEPINHHSSLPPYPPSTPPQLRNLGNTCFFNAALQGIISTREFYTMYVMRVYGLPAATRATAESTLSVDTYTQQYEVLSKTSDIPLQCPITIKPGDFTVAFNVLLWKVHQSTVLSPRDLLRQLGRRNSRFTRGTQEDSHEALRCMFDAVKDEEIQPIRRHIQNLINSKVNSDNEENLKLKGYLRMVTKASTAIGQVIEGKIISVTICHECLDVTENVESFFDISLPMPEGNAFKKVKKKESLTSKKKERKNKNKVSPESGSKSSMESPTPTTLPDKIVMNKKEIATDRANMKTVADTKAHEQTDTYTISLDDNGNDTSEQHESRKVTDIDTLYTEEYGDDVSGQQFDNIQRAHDKEVSETANSQTDDALAANLQDKGVSQYTAVNAEIEIEIILKQMATDKLKSRKESKSMENPHDGSATSAKASVPQNPISHGMQSTASDGLEAADVQNSNFTTSNGASASSSDKQHAGVEYNVSLINSNSVQQNAAVSPKHMPLAASSTGTASTSKHTTGLKAQQSTEENSSYSAELSTFQRTEELRQQHQGVHGKDTHEEDPSKYRNAVTKDRDVFQQYLVKKQLNHLTKGNRKQQTINKDLHPCLFMHTDLDVLDEENKFICHNCTAKKQQENSSDELAMCLVSKQLMIHQLPPVLILHMKRFEIGYSKVTKDSRYISFPEILDMSPYCTVKCLEDLGDSENRILYGLYAVIDHSGGTLCGGHYTAYVKTDRPLKEKRSGRCMKERADQKYDTNYCKKGQWYYTSDTYVRKCSFEDVRESEAYMMFYERLPLTK